MKLESRRATGRIAPKLNAFLDHEPGTAIWWQSIRNLEKYIEQQDINGFHNIIQYKQFEDVLMLSDVLPRFSKSREELMGWISVIAWDFGDTHDYISGETDNLYRFYYVAKLRYERALRVYGVASSDLRTPYKYRQLREAFDWGEMSIKWLDETCKHTGFHNQKIALVRLRFAGHSVERVRYSLNLKRVQSRTPESLSEPRSEGRRFGGGRPRAERYRRR